MKDLLLYIAKNLVEHPDEVTVTEKQGTDELTLELHVAPDDMGKPHRQRDPYSHPLLCAAHRRESIGRYC